MIRLLMPVLLVLAACREADDEGGATTSRTAQSSAAMVTSAVDDADSTYWRAVDQAMGRSGKLQPDGGYKYTMPRGDLRVRAGVVAVKPALALGSWIAFKRQGDGAMAMGDLVLTEDEIAPVMRKLQELGIEQTALHNHLLHESPGVMYLHIHGQGDPVKVAQAMRAALALTKTPPAQPESASPAGGPTFDTASVARALGHSGKLNGGVYQVSVPRAEAIRAEGMEVPASMGVATAINFQPTGGGNAAVTGDFVMTAAEVNPVLKALSQAGIEVTALHSHMLVEEPRLLFAHFWGSDDAVKLARGLRAALQKTNSKQGAS